VCWRPPAKHFRSGVAPQIRQVLAYVGTVGEEDVKDFSALGDVVNTAAWLKRRHSLLN
jgi:hypothetical protein